MGYLLAMGPCYVCKNVFTFNPDRVPSYMDEDGIRYPICKKCITETINPHRLDAGKEPWPVYKDSYGPEEVE